MKIFRNTSNIDFFMDLTTLLKKGFSLHDSLHLLSLFNKTNELKKLIQYLDEGYSINEVVCLMNLELVFKQTFLCLYPIKGLSDALEEAYNFSKEKDQWIHLIKKQWSYPLLLLTIMAAFSLFVKVFLLPEMERLLMSFNNNYNFKTSLGFLTIQVIPSVMMIILIILFVIFLICYITVTKNKGYLIHILLKIPEISYFLRLYYSLMFSFYFSKVTSFFENFFESIKYLENFFKNTHLNDVFTTISKQLNEGKSIDVIIQGYPLFTKQLKSYFSFLFQSQQSLYDINDYCVLTISLIERKIKKISKIILIFIYFITGIYILSLYSLMILPILELSTTL